MSVGVTARDFWNANILKTAVMNHFSCSTKHSYVKATLAGGVAKSESAYFVSLIFCVLDNNIRNFKCVLSGADYTAQEMAKSLEWCLPVPGRIIRPGAG
jgi:hypothetical protein